MKLSINTADLLEAMKSAGKATPNKPSRTEYGFAKLLTESGILSICGTDGDLFITTKAPAEIETHGVTMVRPKDVIMAVQYESGMVEMETSENRVLLCGASLPTADPEEFPIPTINDVVAEFSLSEEEIKALGVTCQTSSVIPRDNSIHIIQRDGYVQFMTQIAGAWMTYIRHEEDVGNGLIPYKYLQAVSESLGATHFSVTEEKTLTRSDLGEALFSNSNGEPIGVDFDLFETVLTCEVDKDRLKEVLDQAEYFSDDTNQVHIVFGEEVTLQVKKGIEFQKSIEAQCSGELDLIFNARLLGSCISDRIEVRKYKGAHAIWLIHEYGNHVIVEMKEGKSNAS